MRIVLASSEAVPYSKTGGLADVTSALAKSLAAAGHNVTLIVPHYPQLQKQNGKKPMASTGQPLQIWLGSRVITANVYWSMLPGSDVTVLFIDQPDFFDRPALYGDKDGDYQDNCARFCFFSRAVMEACRTLVLRPDVIHANDWQTGLVPALLEAEYRDQPGFENTGSVFTIHNLAYQGQFWHWDFTLTGLDWKYFNSEQMEHWGGMNLLKTGISFSDMVTTVSPTYAYEITTPLGGMGLDGTLLRRSGDLVGILNGIDTDEWNPATDAFLPTNYNANNVFEIKPHCKAELQRELNLEVRPDVPLFGMVSRMADQKGFDLIATAADEMLKLDAQFCFLGSGDPRYEALVRHLANSYHGKVAATVGFDNGLAHRIEAGSDAFLMPSRFEPCGLNQMYSLAYGTVPIVRSVGGLKDTVVDASPRNLFLGNATGFRFDDYDANGLLWAVWRATEMYPKKNLWQQLVRSGMSQDFSWGKSAAKYLEVYERAKGRRGSGGERGTGSRSRMVQINSFRELEVYQVAFERAMEIFELSKSFLAEEKYSLTDQIRRCSRSVCSNIAEGCRKRRYPAHFVSKLTDAESEAEETRVWLQFASRCGYLERARAINFDKQYDGIIGRLVKMSHDSDHWTLPKTMTWQCDLPIPRLSRSPVSLDQL